MKKRMYYLKKIIYLQIVVCIFRMIFQYLSYLQNPLYYEVQSASWYTQILMTLLSLMILIICTCLIFSMIEWKIRYDLKQLWKKDEEVAFIHGWDFSHIHGRYLEEHDLPWNYREKVMRYLRDDMKILDYDTGGGEFLLSLKHPYHLTSATEGYPPNVEIRLPQSHWL